MYLPNFRVIFRVSKQQLNTNNKQYAANGNLVGNPVYIKEEFPCLANFRASKQLYEIGPCPN